MAVYVNNITVDTGEYFTIDYYLDNVDGSPLDLSGYSGASQIRKHPDSVNPTATFTVGFPDRLNGRLKLTLTQSQTELIKPGRYVYDVLLTDSSGIKSIAIEGTVLATEDISENIFGTTGGAILSAATNATIVDGDGIYDYYLIEYSAGLTGPNVGINTFVSNDQHINTRTTITSPDPLSTIVGYTGFSTVGLAYTENYAPSTRGTSVPIDRPAGVGIPTYLEYGGGVDHGGSPSSGSFGVTAVGSNRIVVGDKDFRDYDGSITGIANTFLGVAYLFDLNGNPITQINAPDGLNNDDFGGGVGIDSDKIIITDANYSGIHTSQGAVYVFDMDGNFQNRITLANPAYRDYWPFTMAVDNGKIFTSDYNYNVYIHNLDGTGEIKITTSSLTNPDNGGFGDFSIAAGHDKFAVGDYEQIYIFNQDGTGEIRILDPTGGAGYYGDQVAIGGNKVFVADPYYEDPPTGNYIGAVYAYDLDGSNPARYLADTDTNDFFESSSEPLQKMLVASEDYVWYGAIYGYDINDPNTANDYPGIVFRWDIDGSNNVRIIPPSHDQDSYLGENLAVDKTSGKFIVGSGDYGGEEEIYVYSYADTGVADPYRITDEFDHLKDYVLLDRSKFVTNHVGISDITLSLRGGWDRNPPVPDNAGQVKVTVRGYDGGTMEKFGGTWVHSLNTTGTVLGFTTSYVGYGATNINDLGTAIGTVDINLASGTAVFS